MERTEYKMKERKETSARSTTKWNRSLKKRTARSSLTKKEIADEKKGLSYKGDGGALQALNEDGNSAITCIWKGCNGTDHKTRRSKECLYHVNKGWDHESARKEVLRLEALEQSVTQD